MRIRKLYMGRAHMERANARTEALSTFFRRMMKLMSRTFLKRPIVPIAY
jgi:hypothetical protein